MGVMKRRVLFLSLILSAVAMVPAMARVTVEQVTEPEFVMNQGYSQITAEDVHMLKNRNTGRPVEPLYDRDNNALVRGWNAFWGYVDPAHESYDRLHHNVKESNSFSDL